MPSEKWQKARTNINVTKEFRDEMQRVVDLYRQEKDCNITISRVVESLVYKDEYITSLYNKVKEK